MRKTLAAEHSWKTLNPTLLALKPRQVLLSRADMGKKEADEKERKTINLKPDQKVLLLRSIAQYLDRCGFSKCLKKFLSEAEIEKKDLECTLPDLEEVYWEYSKKRDHEAGDSTQQKTEDIQTRGKKEEENASNDQDKGKKDNKKKKKEPKSEVTQEKSKDRSSKNKKETDVKIEPKNCDSSAAEASKDAHEDVEKGKKDKKEKKKELNSEVTEKVKDGSSENKKETDVEMGERQKDKKKKKKLKSGESESLDDDKTHEENEAEKVSKKRKRPETEEENGQTMDDREDEESKRRKKDDSVDANGVQKIPAKQPDVLENGNVENTEAKSANQKSGKKLDGSKEPKKPFQRVNVEEVEFIDERLKDNSYWAKDGADSGYGAKAQEVLGQVRGKGFRHEKTKKKRGSYRGGQIDLQSHSVKFNYSDEE